MQSIKSSKEYHLHPLYVCHFHAELPHLLNTQTYYSENTKTKTAMQVEV